MTNIDNILVLGGSGFLGRCICEELVRRGGGAGGPIAVATRHAQRARELLPLPTLVIEEADVHDDAQLAKLLHGRDAVINLIGILHGTESDFRRAHADLPRRLGEACAAANVHRLVHVSAIGASPDGPSLYLKSKAEGEEAIRRLPLAWTILRPSVMFGAEDHFVNLFANLQTHFPVVPLAGADAQLQPVWVEDVARAIALCIDQDASVGQTYECAGPEVMTLGDVVRLAGVWSRHARRVIKLPHALAWLEAQLFEVLPGEPLLTRDNLKSLEVPNVASGKLPGLKDLGVEPTPMEGVMAPLLGHEDRAERLQSLRATAGRS